MTYVALGAMLLAAVELYVIWRLVQLINQGSIDARESERQTKVELLSVLGKTETVALSLNDQRPKGQVTYVDEARMVELERMANA